jgi:methionyl-tRNA formyltransferase
VNGERFIIEKARLIKHSTTKLPANLPLGISLVDNVTFGVCGDGKAIEILALQHQGHTLDKHALAKFFSNFQV